jgi:hypothetical protein
VTNLSLSPGWRLESTPGKNQSNAINPYPGLIGAGAGSMRSAREGEPTWGQSLVPQRVRCLISVSAPQCTAPQSSPRTCAEGRRTSLLSPTRHLVHTLITAIVKLCFNSANLTLLLDPWERRIFYSSFYPLPSCVKYTLLVRSFVCFF